jgi:hypothetical protein
VPLVDARHVEIDVPALRLDGIDHVGHVRRDADDQAGIADAFQEILRPVQFASLEHLVRHLAVMGDGHATALLQPLDVRWIARGQRDVPHLQAAVGETSVHIEIAQSVLPAVDADLLTAGQRPEDLLFGVVFLHRPIDEDRQMRTAVEAVAPQITREMECGPSWICGNFGCSTVSDDEAAAACPPAKPPPAAKTTGKPPTDRKNCRRAARARTSRIDCFARVPIAEQTSQVLLTRHGRNSFNGKPKATASDGKPKATASDGKPKATASDGKPHFTRMPRSRLRLAVKRRFTHGACILRPKTLQPKIHPDGSLWSFASYCTTIRRGLQTPQNSKSQPNSES